MDKPIPVAPSPEGPWLPLLARAVSVSGRLAELSARRDDPVFDHDRLASAFPDAEFALLAESGLLAAPVPRRFGGGGLNGVAGGTLTLLQLLKQVGRGSLPTGRIYEGHVNAHALVEWFGTEEQQARAAADTVRDGRIFGVWNAEEEPPGIGLKLVDLGQGRYRMEGGKLFCSGLGRVTRPIIGGRWEGGGWQMCLVPMDEIAARVDHSWWQPLGMESTVSGAIDLTGIELSRDTLLGAPDDYYRSRVSTAGRSVSPPCNWAGPRRFTMPPVPTCKTASAPTTPANASAPPKRPCGSNPATGGCAEPPP